MDFQVCLFFLQTRKLWAATSLKMTKQPPPPNNNNNLTCTLLLMLTYNSQGLCLRMKVRGMSLVFLGDNMWSFLLSVSLQPQNLGASHPRSDCD